VGRRRIHAPRVTNAHTDERRSAQRRETEEKQPRGSRLGATRRRYTAHGIAAKLYAAKRYTAYLLLYKCHTSFLSRLRPYLNGISLDGSIYFYFIFKSNESWKLILNIYVLIAFQWYKDIFKLISFDSYNCALKIWESIWNSDSHNESSLESVKVHSLRLLALPRTCEVSPRLPFWHPTL
jgi:hypothetical protein